MKSPLILCHSLPFHQGVLQTTQAESEHWQSLCEELREGSNHLKQRQVTFTDQILHLQAQLEVQLTNRYM